MTYSELVEEVEREFEEKWNKEEILKLNVLYIQKMKYGELDSLIMPNFDYIKQFLTSKLTEAYELGRGEIKEIEDFLDKEIRKAETLEGDYKDVKIVVKLVSKFFDIIEIIKKYETLER